MAEGAALVSPGGQVGMPPDTSEQLGPVPRAAAQACAYARQARRQHAARLCGRLARLRHLVRRPWPGRAARRPNHRSAVPVRPRRRAQGQYPAAPRSPQCGKRTSSPGIPSTPATRRCARLMNGIRRTARQGTGGHRRVAPLARHLRYTFDSRLLGLWDRALLLVGFALSAHCSVVDCRQRCHVTQRRLAGAANPPQHRVGGQRPNTPFPVRHPLGGMLHALQRVCVHHRPPGQCPSG